MRTGLAAACALAAAACAGQVPEPSSLVDNPVYTAAGSPGWRVEIGDDIALRLGHHFFDDDIVYATYLYPARPPRTWNGVRRWRSRRVASWILVEAEARPCTLGERVYEDTVKVIALGHRLTGCGGRWVGPSDD